MRLTHPMLRDLEVGPAFCSRFHRLYPDGVDLTREVLADMEAEGFDLVWLARAMAPAPMRVAERAYLDERAEAKQTLVRAGEEANARFRRDDEVAWEHYRAAAENVVLSWEK